MQSEKHFPPGSLPRSKQLTLIRLRRGWAQTAAISGIIWLGFYIWFLIVWAAYAGRWAILSGLMMVVVLRILWRGLPDNHRQGETDVLPTLGLGNLLSLYRGVAVALLAGFLFSPWPIGVLAWVPALLYMTADIADYLDGYAARITNHATLLGETLDMEYDSLGALVVTLLAIWYGQLPWWYMSLALARYFFIFGLWWRERRALSNHDIPPSVHRRIFGGFQMGFLSAVLWPILPPAGASIAAAVVATFTGLSFLRDWLVIIGWLDTKSPAYQRGRRWLGGLTIRWLPILLRLLFAMAMTLLIARLPALFPVPAWTNLVASWHLPWPATISNLLAAVMLGASAAVILGFMGRITAFLMVFPLGFSITTTGLNWVNGFAIACMITFMMIGSGRYSLWQPEDPYMKRRAGEA